MDGAWLWTSVATDVYPLYPPNNWCPHVTVSAQTSTARSQSGVTWRHRAVSCPPLGYVISCVHACTATVMKWKLLYTSIHLIIIVQEHRHPHTVAKTSVLHLFPSLNLHIFSLHCTVLKENICLPFKSSSAHHHHHVLCPKAGPALQADKPRLQFCRRTANSGTKAAVLLGI